MDDLPPTARILKSLIAQARHSEGPTLYVICLADDQRHCVIYEQLPDGSSFAWTDHTSQCVQQAESLIYRGTETPGRRQETQEYASYCQPPRKIPIVGPQNEGASGGG